MKKSILLIATAIVMFSCSALKSTSTSTASSTSSSTSSSTTTTTTTTTSSSSNTSAVSAGQTAGAALLAMYTQYQADGNKFDYKNLNNIISTMQLVSACEGLKENKSDKTYLKSFGKGMMASAAGLVTETNVNSVTTSLTDMMVNNTTINSAATTAADKLQTAASTASSISSILSLFSGK